MPDADEQARRHIVQQALQRYERPLVTYASQLLGDEHRAREVTQDTFMKLWQQPAASLQHMARNSDGQHLGAWLFAVCRNGALDRLRREGLVQPTADAGVAQADPSGGPGEAAEHDEAVSAVVHLLDRLPAKQREVVRLKFQAGLTYRQIAAVTGLTVSYVGYLLHTAIKTLRAQMGEDEPEA